MRNSLTLIIVFLIGLFSIHGALTTGVMWDSDLHAATPTYNKGVIQNGTPLPFDMARYGTVIDFSAHGLYRFWQTVSGAKKFAAADPDRHIVRGILPGNDLVADPRFNIFKNCFVAIFCLLGYFAAALAVAVVAGNKAAALGPLTLFLSVHYFGNSLFNFKDAPFAAAFTVSSTLAAIFAARFLDPVVLNRQKPRFPLALTLTLAIAIGITAGIRLGGVVLLAFIPIVELILLAVHRPSGLLSRVAKFFAAYIVLVLLTLIFIFAVHPSSWSQPFTWFRETLEYLAHHAFSGPVLFEGNYVPSQELPARYLPLYFLISIPESILLLAGVGVLFSLAKIRRFGAAQLSTVLFLLLQMLFLPIFAILQHSTLDAGIRQMLFVVPALAIFAALGISFTAQCFSNIRAKQLWALAVVALFVPIARDFVALHPYEYIYFNRLAQVLYDHPKDGKPIWQQFENDYLGISMRAATEWLDFHEKNPATVYLNGPFHSSALFADPQFKILHLAHVPGPIKPFYYIAPPRGRWDRWFPECQESFRVERMLRGTLIPLSVTKYCP